MIVLMEQMIILILLGILGLMMGSFAGATVWRLRARQLAIDKAEGEEVNTIEYKRLKSLAKSHIKDDRSRCLSCNHQLAWYDLFPLFSWASTGGRCRYCKKPIGIFEPLIELGVAVLFICIYLLQMNNLLTPLSIIAFILMLIISVMLAILFSYDLKWFLLPDSIMFPFIALSACIALIHFVSSSNVFVSVLNVLLSIAILSGIYLALWVWSKGEWIGFGDVKLGLGLALLLCDWRLAFLALFSANLIGCLIVLPGFTLGKVKRSTKVPFGPLLIAGGLVALFLGQEFVTWYSAIII
jgi:prepilin signal peptidase PulO-like enzyme (type II secretory pathway)